MVEGTQISALENRITELEKENLLLREKAAFLTRKLYGRSKEQTSSLEIEGQMSFLMKRKTRPIPKPNWIPASYRDWLSPIVGLLRKRR